MALVRYYGAHTLVILFLFAATFVRATEPDYIIRRVTISGIFTGKDIAKNVYSLSKGMIFKEAEHEDGVRSLREHFKKQGYLAAQVTSRCVKDDQRRTVSLQLQINCGRLFTIRSVTCRSAQELSRDPGIADFLRKIEKKIALRLEKSTCSNDLLDTQTAALSAYCAKKGYLFAGIERTLIPDTAAGVVDILFTCSLTHKKQLTFVGNSACSTERLYALCSEFGKALLIIPPEVLVTEMVDFYQRQGYLDVQIRAHDDEQGTVFQIAEGPRAVIKQVQLNGLDECLFDKPPESFFTALLAAPYDQQRITLACQALMLFAVQQGYGGFVLDEIVPIKLAQGEYLLSITARPGKRITIAHITTTDFNPFVRRLYTQKWCKPYSHLFDRPGDQPSPAPRVVDMADVARMRKFLQRQLQDAGYLYTHVTPHFSDADDATLQWVFTGKHEPVRFGETVIKGSCVLSDETIKKALAYKKGDIWDKKRIDQTATQLRNCGVFDSVTLFPENITQQEDEKNIIIQIQDSDPFELRTRLGFQGVGTNLSWRGGGTYKVGGTFVWKNPLRSADLALVQLDVTRFLRYVTLSYQRAFLGPFPIRQQFKGYSNWYNQPVVLGSREILYRFTQNGFLWALNRSYTDSEWGVTSGIEWMEISDISQRLSHAINFTSHFIDKQIPYLFCEPSVYAGKVDNRLDPLQGWYIVCSCKALVPLTIPDGSSLKFLVEQGSYIPLHRESHTVFALRIRAGTILYQSFSNIMPPERFYLGGAYSLRGYEPDLAPPLNFYKNSQQELIVVPTGGKTMMNANFEVRMTLYKSLGGTIFTDIGLLTHRAFTDIHTRDVLGATGFGLRWNTPVGPLRFDIGWKWKRFPGNQGFYDQASYAWFLTLGNAF